MAITSPDSAARRARLTLGLLLAINLFNYIDRQVLSAVEEKIHGDLLPNAANPETLLGLLNLAFLFSYMILAPVFGVLADRVSRWMLVGVGVILWSLASGASGLASTYIILLITRCFVGVGEAAYGPVAPTLIADMYPIARRGQVLAWFYLAIPVGSAIGYAVGGLVTTWWGWRWAFYTVVPWGLVLGVLALMMREPPRGGADATKVTHKATGRDYLSLIHNRSYLYNTLGMTAMTFAIGGISFWMPRYLSAYRKAAEFGNARLVFGIVAAVAGLTATLLGGMLADHLRTRVRGSYLAVSAAALVVALPCIIGLIYLPFPAAWVALFLSVFFIFFGTGPTNTALANVTHPSIRASAFAVNILVIHLFGDALAPFLLGWVFDHTRSTALPEGNMDMGLWLVVAMLLVGAALWYLGARHLDEDTEKILRAPAA